MARPLVRPPMHPSASVSQTVAGEELERIRALAAAATELAAPELAQEAGELAERAAAGLFYLACVGEFKRGKSTLLNALLGARVLPAGLLPVTAVPTIVRFGPVAGATVRFRSGSSAEIATERLAEFVAEAGNPENERGVVAVEVRYPAGLLREGLCLVDTPGLGSVVVGATELTRAFVPHVDAALAVVGVDPPISDEEATIVEAIGRQTSHLIIVMSKADRFSASDLDEAAAFAERVLTRKLGRPVAGVLRVSAEAVLSGDAGSDWSVLVQRLQSLAREKRQAIVQAAVERGARRLSAAILGEADRRIAALLRPIEESERDIDALRSCLADLDRQLLYLDQQLAAEHGLLRSTLVTDRTAFLADALPAIHAEVDRILEGVSTLPRPGMHQAALEAVERAVRARLEPWLTQEEGKARELYGDVVRRFSDLAGDFITRAARMDQRLIFADLDEDPGDALRRGGGYYFHPLANEFYDRAPLIGLARSLLSRGQVLRSARRRALRYAERLMDVNSARVQNSLDERVRESRRTLSVEIRRALTQARSSAERALTAARTARSAGEEAVAGELARLRGIRARIVT